MLSTLPRLDYTDAFVVETGPSEHLTGKQWARAMLEGAPPDATCAATGLGGLGLKLGSMQDDQLVLGWDVAQLGRTSPCSAPSSPLGLMGEVLFKRRRHTLLLATFIQLDSSLMRAVWLGFAPGHGQAVRSCSGRAPAASDQKSPLLADTGRERPEAARGGGSSSGGANHAVSGRRLSTNATAGAPWNVVRPDPPTRPHAPRRRLDAKPCEPVEPAHQHAQAPLAEAVGSMRRIRSRVESTAQITSTAIARYEKTCTDAETSIATWKTTAIRPPRSGCRASTARPR